MSASASKRPRNGLETASKRPRNSLDIDVSRMFDDKAWQKHDDHFEDAKNVPIVASTEVPTLSSSRFFLWKRQIEVLIWKKIQIFKFCFLKCRFMALVAQMSYILKVNFHGSKPFLVQNNHYTYWFVWTNNLRISRVQFSFVKRYNFAGLLNYRNPTKGQEKSQNKVRNAELPDGPIFLLGTSSLNLQLLSLGLINIGPILTLLLWLKFSIN